jgi:mono/diheme cytochrome c family protein
MKAVLKAFLLLVTVLAVFLMVTFIWIGSRGISARAEPGAIETAVARTMRRLAIPPGDRHRQNPIKMSPDVLAAGMTHYADHCAACHANDGSGETQVGFGLYPRPPDMRQSTTQSLSDGELFYIIENGVRLTGVPAWGTGKPDEAEETWHLVHFIRHLPRITAAELEDMKGMNPTSRDQLRHQMEEEKFLKGETAAPPPRKPPHVH